MSISLVAGLGNPGRDYANTRHNLGWIVIEALARKQGVTWQAKPSFEAEIARWDYAPGRTRWLVKPLTFMNESGRSVAAVARYYKLRAAEIAIVYDDINIEVGLVKVSESGSAGGHNGVASLLEHLGPEFVRFRLGIGPKQPDLMDIRDFVLGKFTTDQSILIQQKLNHTIDGLELLLNRGASFAMNQLNRRNPSP
ncbi:MAG: aminoacyl-tRNA hydrolase [Undibacterium sp.]|nr:aminoacyl-tRNA hydrolase [Opitutaceae bacterium]